MASDFGIFREDSVPVLQGVPKELPPVFKGKAQLSNIKKKALGDVSNTVTQKALTMKPNDVAGKPSEGSCSRGQLTASLTSKLIGEKKEVVEELAVVGFDVVGWDYDILPKSQRLFNKDLDLFSTPFSFNAAAASPPSTKINYDPPSGIFPMDIEDVPLEDFSLEDIPVYDVSF